jgi:ribosomal protein L17
VKPQDLREVVLALVSKAKSGDVAAAKEVLQRLLGPPVELDLIDRLAALEQKINELQQRGQTW